MSSTDLWNVWDVYESPLGRLTLTGSARGLTGLWFPGSGGPFNELDRRPEAFREANAQLDEYFAGERRYFELELDLWGSRFDQRVWQELQLIPSERRGRTPSLPSPSAGRTSCAVWREPWRARPCRSSSPAIASWPRMAA
jgi:hypothetical protein